MPTQAAQRAAILATVTANDKSVEVRNQHWLLRVDIDGWLNPGYLLDLAHNRAMTDELYCYQLTIAPRGEWGYVGPSGSNQAAPATLSAQGIFFSAWSESDLPSGGKEVRFRGRVNFGLLGPTDIFIEHIFR